MVNPGKPREHLDNEPLISVVNSAEDLTTARAIRKQVFVQEQGIPAELDDDGLDDGAIHTLLWIDGKAAGTGRLVVSPTDTGILARIAILAQYRGRQYGRLIVSALDQKAVDLSLARLELCPHIHLQGFYQDLGYQTTGGRHRAGPYDLITMEKTRLPPKP